MTELKFENYKELKEWKEHLDTLKNIINQSKKTQFGSKCVIGNKPAEFIQELTVLINQKQKLIQEMMDEV